LISGFFLPKLKLKFIQDLEEILLNFFLILQLLNLVPHTNMNLKPICTYI